MNKLSKLKKQIAFIAEVDKLKNILRKTSPIGMERKENSAEHSWQVILSAIIFLEHANETQLDLLKVIKMLAIHDIVEIDVGDTFHYDKAKNENLYQLELAAAERIFGMLDQEQKKECLALWQEFEARETPEAQYAAAVDRFIAFIINSRNKGGTWATHQITVEKALDKNVHIAQGSNALWEMTKAILTECAEQGYITSE